jgi:nucleoside-diphosphate-sugar epimerase
MSSSKPTVLLTGVTGFVGAHVFDKLLSHGYNVLGVVRNPSKTAYFRKKYADQTDSFGFVTISDIQAPNALDEVMPKVDYVCHVASPYFTSTTDPIKELVEPAVNGTTNVLNSAIEHGTKLRKVTVLSSFASVVDLEKNPRPGYTYTEKDWDPVTTEQAKKDGFWGYHASKTFAERQAWELHLEANPKWDLITFCPPMIYGPPIHEVHVSKGIDGLNTSVKRLMTSIMGKDPDFAPKVATPGLPAWIDVRNVAEAHVKALSLPEGKSERFLLCSSVKYYEDGLDNLRARGEKGLGEKGQKCNPANHFAIDASKAIQMMGIEMIPFEKTVEDTWEAMGALGFDLA